MSECLASVCHFSVHFCRVLFFFVLFVAFIFVCPPRRTTPPHCQSIDSSVAVIGSVCLSVCLSVGRFLMVVVVVMRMKIMNRDGDGDGVDVIVANKEMKKCHSM